MKLPISIQTKTDVHKGTIPTSWDDISHKQFYDLVNWSANDSEDLVKLYAILTGIDEKVMERCSNFSVSEVIDRNIGWMTKDAGMEKKKCPSYIEWKGELIEVPQELMFKEFGQYLAVRSERQRISQMDLSDSEKDRRLNRVAVAYLMAQELIGEFDEKKIKDLEIEIDSLPASVVIPLSFFFERQLQKLISKEVTGLEESQVPKNWLRDVRSWISSVISQQ